MENRRKSLRIPIIGVAHVIHQDRQLTSKVLLRDLSRTGVGGYINYPCQKGDPFLINLKLTSQDNQVIEGLLTGEICWSCEINEGKKYAFGLGFHEMEIQHTKLYAYLLTLEKSYIKELEETYQLPQSS